MIMDTKYKVKADTIARTIILALALINQLLSATGHAVIPIADETIESLISYIVTVVVAIWTYWKNNSWTQPALHADEVMDELKAIGKQIEEKK